VLAEARTQAAQVITEARAVGKRVEEQATQKAALSAEQILAHARDAAVVEHDHMLADLRRDVGRLVVQTTEAIVGRVVTSDDQRRLAEDTARFLKAG
jgi:F-type H+-transporting ATPase subunit b